MTTKKSSSDTEEFAIGATGPEIVVKDVDIEDFVRYAGASGDFNPMHYDIEHARESGYDSIFGQGMFTAGLLSRMVREWVGLAALQSFSTRFREQVMPGDDLYARGEIVGIDDVTGAVEAETVVETSEGRTVITGSFRALPHGSDDNG